MEQNVCKFKTRTNLITYVRVILEPRYPWRGVVKHVTRMSREGEGGRGIFNFFCVRYGSFLHEQLIHPKARTTTNSWSDDDSAIGSKYNHLNLRLVY